MYIRQQIRKFGCLTCLSGFNWYSQEVDKVTTPGLGPRRDPQIIMQMQ